MILLKTVNELCPLQSGMCIEIFRGNTVARGILFKTDNNPLCMIDYDSEQSWTMVETLWFHKDSEYGADRVKVYSSPTGIFLFDKDNIIFDSEKSKIELTLEDIANIIFDSEKSKIELTLEDIAKKYGVNPENITIK